MADLRGRDLWSPTLDETAVKDEAPGRPKRPTAIFCSDDQIVPDVYSILHAHRLRIPRDMAVLGRGNLTLIQNLAPELSTIAIPAFHIGKRAAELLIDTLKDKEAPSQKILLPCTLIKRQSA